MSKEAIAARNKKRAADLKAAGVERTTCRCANCYRIIACDSCISKYKHICRA